MPNATSGMPNMLDRLAYQGTYTLERARTVLWYWNPVMTKQITVCFECLRFRLRLFRFLRVNGQMVIRMTCVWLNCHSAINTQTQTETEAYRMLKLLHFRIYNYLCNEVNLYCNVGLSQPLDGAPPCAVCLQIKLVSMQMTGYPTG